MHIRRGRYHGVDQLGFAVHADMSLHAEIPLLTLARLVHVRIALFGGVLRRGRRVDDRRIDDRAGGDPHAAVIEVDMHLLKHLPSQVVLLQHMAKLVDGGLVRHRLMPKVDASKTAHRGES